MESFKFLIPEESREVMVENVPKLRKIESDLRALFTQREYLETIMPSFEYADLYKSIYQDMDESKLFKYINQKGEDIALRWDFTIPLARYYISQTTEDIARYCYFGKVFRKEKEHKGKESELYQAGIELIHKAGPEGDFECLAILEDSLSVLGLEDLRIELGSAKFFNRICEMTGKKEELMELLSQKKISGIKKFVQQYKIEENLAELLIKIPRLSGDITVLEEALEKIQDEELRKALLELKQIYEKMKYKKQILFDLGFVPSMQYYTGVVFKVYSKDVSQPIISGGRYDDLYKKFGKEIPAIGMAYYQDAILKALKKVGENNG